MNIPELDIEFPDNAVVIRDTGGHLKSIRAADGKEQLWPKPEVKQKEKRTHGDPRISPSHLLMSTALVPDEPPVTQPVEKVCPICLNPDERNELGDVCSEVCFEIQVEFLDIVRNAKGAKSLWRRRTEMVNWIRANKTQTQKTLAVCHSCFNWIEMTYPFSYSTVVCPLCRSMATPATS